MRTNSYPGYCVTCKNRVQEQKGFIFKLDGRWKTVCNSDRCIPKSLQTEHKAQNVRQLKADGRVITPYEPNNLHLLRAFPGARWNREQKCWMVSLDMGDRRRVLELADQLKLDVDSSLREIKFDAKIQAVIDAAEVKGAYPFQLEGIRFLATSNGNALLADDQGTGKTIQSLLALPIGGRCLAVVPASVKRNWAAECKIWRPDLTPVVLEGRKSFRWPEPGELIIINPDIMPKLSARIFLGSTYPERAPFKMQVVEGTGGFYAIPEGDIPKSRTLPSEEVSRLASTVWLIADEAHMYKNHKAARSQTMTAISSMVAKSIPMTGTPLLNQPFDLWGVLNTFGLSWKVFGTFKRFVNLFGGFKNEWGGYEWAEEPSPEVSARLRRVMLRRTKAQVLPDLPAKTFQKLVVPTGLGKRDEKAMAKFMDNWAPVLDGGDLPPFEELSAIRAKLAKARIPYVIELVESYEDSNTPLVVFSAHRAPIDALGKREGWRTITGDTKNETRQEIVEAFQAGDLKGVALTIAAGGVGLTLTHAATMLFVDKDWTPALNIQAEDRIHRIGQDVGAHYIDMVSDHPLDLRVHELLAEKIIRIRAALEEAEDFVAQDGRSADIKVEDEAAFETRMEVIREAQRRQDERGKDALDADTRTKLEGWTDRYSERNAKKVQLPLTPEHRELVTDAMFAMLGVCDGAATKDGMGFNKPDAYVARRLLSLGLCDDDTLRVAERMLAGYPKQLKGSFPALFKKQNRKAA